MPDGFDARMDAVAALGQRTGPLRAELGFTPAEIDRMKAEAAV